MIFIVAKIESALLPHWDIGATTGVAGTFQDCHVTPGDGDATHLRSSVYNHFMSVIVIEFMKSN